MSLKVVWKLAGKSAGQNPDLSTLPVFAFSHSVTMQAREGAGDIAGPRGLQSLPVLSLGVRSVLSFSLPLRIFSCENTKMCPAFFVEIYIKKMK